MRYLCIDPGSHPGWAVLDGDHKITGCGINTPPKYKFDVVLAERPTVYPHSDVNPANIITLAITLGKMIRPYEDLGSKVVLVEPRTWKGQIPKKVHHPIIRKSLAAGELLVVDNCLKDIAKSWCEDAMDAVGLAVYGRKNRIFA